MPLYDVCARVQSRNHVVSEICQRRQNSAMSLLKYGTLKLRISLIPNNLAVPMAMSE